MPGDVEEKQGRLHLAPLPSVLQDVLSPAQLVLLQHRTLQFISLLPVGASLRWCALKDLACDLRPEAGCGGSPGRCPGGRSAGTRWRSARRDARTPRRILRWCWGRLAVVPRTSALRKGKRPNYPEKYNFLYKSSTAFLLQVT